jgi:hypothetical protein
VMLCIIYRNLYAKLGANGLLKSTLSRVTRTSSSSNTKGVGDRKSIDESHARDNNLVQEKSSLPPAILSLPTPVCKLFTYVGIVLNSGFLR